jgi:protein tyrosine phosphatase (PTP) superfamily phosphohydrolase (DUF442 family)
MPRSPSAGPPRQLRAVFLGVAVGLVCAVVGEGVRVLAGGNEHAVLPGRVYRCSQPSPERLERLVRAYGIRTVVNLRGCCSTFDWYKQECRVTHALEVAQEDVCFSAGRLPSTHEVRRLLEVLDHSEYPLLLHCQRGADRTGLTAAVAVLLQTDAGLDEGRRQLGLRYGHVALGRPANLDRFFDLYAGWLREHGVVHSPAVFRAWLDHGYTPGPCLARVELLDPVAGLPPMTPSAVRVRAHNTSPETWHFKAGSVAGVHVSYALEDEQGRAQGVGKSGLFDAEVPPGGSIDVTLALPRLRPGHYRLLVDLLDEQHGCFYQAGSEPLEEELTVREEIPAAGGERGPAGPAGEADGLAAPR